MHAHSGIVAATQAILRDLEKHGLKDVSDLLSGHLILVTQHCTYSTRGFGMRMG